MPQMREIKRRIRSIKSTQQITRAMKMVAAAKLRRAQTRLIRFRPYSESIGKMLVEFLPQTSRREHPLLITRPEDKVILVAVTGDRGLCGGFNMNVIRHVGALLGDPLAGKNVQLIGIGARGNRYLKGHKAPLKAAYDDIYDRLSFITVSEITEEIIELYKREEIDALYITYNHFYTVVTQRVETAKVLPLDLDAIKKRHFKEGDTLEENLLYEFEPGIEALSDELISRFVATELFRAVAESIASEFAARMTAMDAATRNADDLIQMLTLQYNRARQASITKEISEIVGGAEAMTT